MSAADSALADSMPAPALAQWLVTAPVAAVLLWLADPEKPAPGPGSLDPARSAALIELARAHGVYGIVWRKLHGGVVDVEEVVHALGQSMLLDRLRQQIVDAFAAAGIAASVVKGPVFAGQLYAHPGDRLFTDIDFLVERDALGAAAEVLASLGYRGDVDAARRSLECKFGHPEHRHVLIELHGDMVHYPLLRRRARFGRRELLRAGDGNGEDAGALLATAIVHATLGHKFERLGMLVDVLQAVRKLPRGRHPSFRATMTALGLGLECAVCLGLVARAFAEPAARELAGGFRAGWKGGLGALLVTPPVVVATQMKPAQASWLRRKAFRMVQYLP